MPPKKSSMHSKPYTFLDHHENDEEAQTTPTPAPEAPSGNTQDAADTAVPTDLAVFASPPAVEGTTAPEPAVPASGSSDSLGFVEKSKGKKRVQHISWRGANERKLLILGFLRGIERAEIPRVAPCFSKKPKESEKAVEVYCTKKRAERRDLLLKAGIYKEDPDSSELKLVPNPWTEEEDAARDAEAADRSMEWSAEADRELLRFGFGRKLKKSTYGRMARRIPGHHSRQAIGERIDHLYNQESLPALAEVGLKPAPSVLDASSSAPKPPTDTNSTPYAPSIPASTNQHQGIIHPTPGDVAAHPPPPFGPFGGRPTRQQGHPTPQGLYNTFGYPAPLRPDIDPFTGLPRTRLDDLELPPPVEEQMRRAQAVNMARRELRDHDAARTRLVARLAEAERDAAEFDETEEHRKRGGDRQEREREE